MSAVQYHVAKALGEKDPESANRAISTSFCTFAALGSLVLLATGVLAATPLYRPEAYVRDVVGAHVYHPSAEVLGVASDAYRQAPSARTLRADDLLALRERGVPVCVFTVNQTGRSDLAWHLAEAGVAGLFTDRPARMRPCLDER